MPNLNDARVDVLRSLGYTGTTNDMLYEFWGQFGGPSTGSLNDRMHDSLKTLGFVGQINDRWYKYLQSLGYEGNINDKELQFWLNLRPPLGFTPTIIITSDSPFNSTGGRGMTLADSVLDNQVERILSEAIYGVQMHDGTLYAINSTALFESTDFGDTFTTYDSTTSPSLGVTSARSLVVVGDHIMISGDNGLWVTDSDISSFTNIPAAPLYSMMRAADGRVFMARDKFDGLEYSDDWGTTRLASSIFAGDATPICTVKPFGNGVVYFWNGKLQVSTDNGVIFSEVVNFPAGSDYTDFELLPSGRLVVTHSNDGIYYTDDLSPTATFTLIQPAKTRNIQTLTDRVVVNGDGGVYYGLNNATDWTFVATPELGADNGTIWADDFTYLVDDTTGEKLYEDGTEDFLIEDTPPQLEVGGLLLWFEADLLTENESDNKNLTDAIDFSGYDSSIGITGGFRFYPRTNEADNADGNVVSSIGNGRFTVIDDHLDDIWAGGATIAFCLNPFDTLPVGESTLCKKGWELAIDNRTGDSLEIKFAHPSGGTDFEFDTDSPVVDLAAPQMIVISWDSDNPNTDPIITLNGVDQAVTKASGGGTPTSDAGLDLLIGNIAGNPTPVIGEFYSYQFYGNALSSQDKDRLFNDADIRYGITEGRLARSTPLLSIPTADLEGWYDASYALLRNPETSGNLVSLASKSSGTTIAPVGPAPEVVPSGQDDKHVIRFAAGEGMIVPEFSATDNIFIGGAEYTFVFRPETFPGSQSLILDKRAWLITLSDKTGTGAKIRFQQGGFVGFYEFVSQDEVIKFSSEYVVSFAWNRDTPTVPPVVYVNGVLVTMDTVSLGSGGFESDSEDGYRFGTDFATLNEFVGDHFEFIINSSIYDDSYRTLLTDELRQKWDF
jgi:hypothetical protein